MELKQSKTVMDVRRGFVMGILTTSVVVVLLAGIVCNYALVGKQAIPVFSVIVFATFIIVLSMLYDIYINSTYRIFIDGSDVYIYYPTYSSRAGNEFIFYKVMDVSRSTVRGSSIVFEGHVEVRTEGLVREGISRVDDEEVHALFEDVFQGPSYQISKKFRISRIFENEGELMGHLSDKKVK